MTHEKYFKLASELAKKATCLRSKCGSIIVKDDEIIGKGVNTPPNNLESSRRCKNNKDDYPKKITDKTCCIHAEQRAMFDALKNNPEKIEGSILYFARLDENEKFQKAGKPYCTICSKMALDLGIKHFALWHEEGIKIYNTEEYNDLSYKFA
jgi:deoxycytidylate deaminase